MTSSPSSPSRALHDAVLIGVRSYPHLDAGDAPGADNDAIAMASVIARLGVPKRAISVLLSPVPIHRSDVMNGGYGAVEQASLAGVGRAIRTLIAALRGDPERRGVLFFAGHGATSGGHLHLCTADTTTDWSGTVSIETLLGWIGDEPLPGLTVVLDCCFAGAAATSGSVPPAAARTLTDQANEGDAGVWRDRLAARVVVLAATGADQSAYAYSLRPNLDREQVVHGVFTWGLSAVLQRWSPDNDPQQTLFPINYGELTHRVAGLCGDLAFDQTPKVWGPPGVQGWLVLRNMPGGVSAAPGLPGRELSGGNNDSVIGDVWLGGQLVGFYVSPGGATYLRAGVQPQPGATYIVQDSQGSNIADGSPYQAPIQAQTSGGTGLGIWNLDARAPSSQGAGALLGSVVMVNEQVVWLWVGSPWPSTFVLTSGQPTSLTSGARVAVGAARATSFTASTIDPNSANGATATYTISQGGATVGWLLVHPDKMVWWRKAPPGQSTLPAWSFDEPGLALTFSQGLQNFSGQAYTSEDQAS